MQRCHLFVKWPGAGVGVMLRSLSGGACPNREER